MQSKHKTNSKLITSAVCTLLSFNVFIQWNMHYFSAQQTRYCCIFFFHLEDRTYLTSARSIPSYSLWAVSSPIAWWCSSSWTCWKWHCWSHQSPCSDPCAPLALQVTALAAAEFWARPSGWPWGIAAVLWLPESLHWNLSISRDHHTLLSGNWGEWL